MSRPVIARASWMAAIMAAGAAAGSAQQVRVTGVTTFQYLDVRPLADDSVLVGDASGSGLLRRSAEGYVVRCTEGDPYCRYRRSIASESTVPLIQDLTANVWGLGRGIRAYARVRGRVMAVGDEALWPRASDHFDVLSAYVEIERPAFRGRAGRLYKTSGLGYYNYDGASFLARPLDHLTVEAYGGWSLYRGLNEPVTSGDLAAVEPLAPDARSYIVGAQASFRPRLGTSVTAVYQREIRDDRLGLYSERVSLDGAVRFGATALDGGFTVDWATATLNDGQLRAWLPPTGPVAWNVYVRHHRPYFDLWTIWGAFTPVGFDEVGVAAAWRRLESGLTVEAWGAARRYADTETDALFGDYRSNGWRVGAAASAPIGDAWHLGGRYRADVGFGAAKSDGSARLRRDLGNGTYIAFNLSAFQRLYELRIDESTVLAAGVDGSLRRGSRTRITGDVTAYRHSGRGQSPNVQWTQVRGSLRIEWTIGAEPAVYRRGGSR